MPTKKTRHEIEVRIVIETRSKIDERYLEAEIRGRVMENFSKFEHLVQVRISRHKL